MSWTEEAVSALEVSSIVFWVARDGRFREEILCNAHDEDPKGSRLSRLTDNVARLNMRREDL